MKIFQLSLFYDLQYFIQTSDFHRKYFLLFKSLELSEVANKNLGIGCTGHSRHARMDVLSARLDWRCASPERGQKGCAND